MVGSLLDKNKLPKLVLILFWMRHGVHYTET